jgi:hypothetical protein
VKRLQAIQTELRAGTLKVELPKRGPKPGRRRGRPAAAKKAAGKAGVRRGRPISISGEPPVAYANVVSVRSGGREARIRFGIALPGEFGARGVADLVVPVELLADLAAR